MDKPNISVSVVYAESDRQWFCRELTLPEGATVHDALLRSEILAAHPEWSLAQLMVGIFSHRRSLDTILHDLDRVEVYRALKIDPRVNRKDRVNSVRDKRKWRQFNKNTQK